MKRLCDCFADPETGDYGNLSDAGREAIVRAVLAELRKPSEVMLAEGLHERNVSGTGPRGLPLCFTRMIDAVLA
jgi:hypothetical protein